MIDFNTLYLSRQKTMVWSTGEDSLHNRAFLFGDGLFETMIFSKGKLMDFSLHLARLRSGISVLGLTSDGLKIGRAHV